MMAWAVVAEGDRVAGCGASVRPGPRRVAAGARLTRGVIVLLAVCVACLIVETEPAAASAAGTEAREVVRIATTRSSLGRINRNDAVAAIRGWGEAILRERGLSARLEVEVFDALEGIRAAMRQQRVDALSLTTQEYLDIGFEADRVFLQSDGAQVHSRYVLLVRRDGGVATPAALAGRPVSIAEGLRMSLAQTWLNALSAGQAPAVQTEEPGKAVLRVFFRQSAGAVVLQEAFDLVGEMNPQIRKELTVLRTSPPLVPTLFVLRPDWQGPNRAALEEMLERLHLSVAGQQVMTLFQGARLEAHPPSVMEDTISFLRQYREGWRRSRAKAANE